MQAFFHLVCQFPKKIGLCDCLLQSTLSAFDRHFPHLLVGDCKKVKKHLPIGCDLILERYNFWIMYPMPKPKKLFLDFLMVVVILVNQLLRNLCRHMIVKWLFHFLWRWRLIYFQIPLMKLLKVPLGNISALGAASFELLRCK